MQPKLIETFEWNTIYDGDALELMAQLPSNIFDAVITDPPFALSGGKSHGRSSLVTDQFFGHWFTDVARQLIRVLHPGGCGFIWCDWRTEHAITKAFDRASERYARWWISQVIYHDRQMPGMGAPFRNTIERILFFRGPAFEHDISRIPRETTNLISEYWYYGKHEWHDAEKSPIVTAKLVEWASGPNQTVLDPFCGGGTVPLVCKALERRWIAFEIDPDTAERARERVRMTQPPLLVPEPEQMEMGL